MKFKNIKAIFLFISILLPVLSSCNNNEIALVDNAINDTLLDREDMRSDLYSRVELSELKIKTAETDPFHLKLSHNDYFYSDDIYVEITCDIDGSEIIYTTNGTDPRNDMNSSENRIYTGPVLIEKGNNNEPTIIKAKAFINGLESDILTHTYFVSEQIDARFDENIYVVSISSDPYNLYDYEYGILISGKLRDEWYASNPGKWPDPPEPANFNIRGSESERPAYIEILNANGERLISQAIGIRVRGAWSRDAVRKSLGIYARSEYDPVFDKFYYDFFRYFDFNGKTTVRGKSNPVEGYSALLLRNGGNDRGGAHMREELSQSLLKKAGFLDFKEFAPAAVFLNGEYYGFLWLEQLFPESYFSDNYGEVHKDYINIKKWLDAPSASGVINDDIFEEYKKTVDLNNYMLYYAFEMYVDNRDWPHNNLKVWCYTGEGGEYINQYYDGKYRFIPYDVEMAWGMYGNSFRERTIQRVRGSSPSFENLMRREDMIEKFCNQMFDLIHSIFTYESVLEEYTKIVDLYDDEVRTAIRYQVSETNRRQLEREREAILKFAENRAEYVIRDMERSFKLNGDVYSVSIIGKDGVSVKLNTLELNGAGKLESNYFHEHSVKISAVINPNYQFDYWLINGKKYESQDFILNSSIALNGNITAELFLK